MRCVYNSKLLKFSAIHLSFLLYCSGVLLHLELLLLNLLQLQYLLLLDLRCLHQGGLHLLDARQLMWEGDRQAGWVRLKLRLILLEKVVLVCFIRWAPQSLPLFLPCNSVSQVSITYTFC